MGEGLDLGDKILLLIIDGFCCAELFAGLAFFGSTCRCKNFASHGCYQLYGGHAYAAASSMDKYGLPFPELPDIENIVPYGEKGFRKGSRLLEIQPFGEGQALQNRCSNIFSVASTGNQGANPVTDLKAVYPLPELNDYTGN